ncbi:HAMP domain-containing sensor histidine kinase [Clostridium septicum]|uniref:HAMP domain-containing sensor histidine kinase n=1 Tax=Clostridium septicum TaxID=1504 RepID=UPI00272E3AFC|nr:HAMP domain-containing sensor histidine kinase [Clostridium septicum]WLF69147.1 HAMP domain-containing sensor histidine kinase [Clostridium septicum]
MKKITKKMIKCMFLINLVSILLGIILIWELLPLVYNNNEFKELEKVSKYVEEAIKNNENVVLDNTIVALLRDGQVINIGKNVDSQMKSDDFESLGGRKIYTTKSGNKYVTYKRSIAYGDLIVYKSYEVTEQLIKSVNVIMIGICCLSLIFSTLLAIYIGNRFTKPIIIIQNRAKDISKGIYTGNYQIDSNDEISDLSDSIEEMALELKAKDNIQRNFIANVSYDFKTPLSIIRANSQEIKNDSITGENLVECSDKIIHEVDMLNSLVEEILLLTKLKENNKFLKLKEQSLKIFLYESFRRILTSKSEYKCGFKNVKYKIDTRVEHLEKFNVKIDEKYLFMVISNIFNNALDYSECSEIALIVENTIYGIKVGIRDNGLGIKEENLKYIWDKYSTGDKNNGMRLGLAISKEIILAHEFNYGVKSKINKGTEFYFVIPHNLIKIK